MASTKGTRVSARATQQRAAVDRRDQGDLHGRKLQAGIPDLLALYPCRQLSAVR